MRIAIFDYKITPNNPIGGCHRRLLEGLCREHMFTVYAVEFDNPSPGHIRWAAVPAPKRPLAALFITYHLVAPLIFLKDQLKSHDRYDLTQFVESNLSFGDVSYSHFCHRVFLKNHWPKLNSRGLRGLFRWLDHWLHALAEPFVYRKVRCIVVPSKGLKRDLESEYPFVAGKIHIIPNPIDPQCMQPPKDLDRAGFRKRLNITAGSRLLVFVALGHFERKGLSLLLHSLQYCREFNLLVVGGHQDLIREWQRRTDQMKLSDRVRFIGMQQDVRPYLWCSDAFALPSHYEAFPLVALEAAAAGLPLLVTPLNGVEEFMRDGETGFIVSPTTQGVLDGLNKLAQLPDCALRAMGERAREMAAEYSIPNFIEKWRGFYASILV